MIKSSKKLNKLFTEMMDLCSELYESSSKFFKIDYEFSYTEHPSDVIEQTLLAIDQSQKRNIPLIRLEDTHCIGYEDYSIYLVISTEQEIEFKLKSAIKELKNLKGKEQEKNARAKKSQILKEMHDLKQKLSTLENSLEEIKSLEIENNKLL